MPSWRRRCARHSGVHDDVKSEQFPTTRRATEGSGRRRNSSVHGCQSNEITDDAIPLHILISNDDGIDAPGIYALVHELQKIARVTVVAPDKQQSAVGHAITMNYPLRAIPFQKNDEFFGYAVEGTPADAVKLAVRFLLKEKPDLLISGINHGSNTAINIIYSGTVSAATEGTILGIPSIAVSLTTYGEPDFSYAAQICRAGWRLLVAERGLPEGTLLNVNVPAVPENEIRGVMVDPAGEIVLG